MPHIFPAMARLCIKFSFIMKVIYGFTGKVVVSYLYERIGVRQRGA